MRNSGTDLAEVFSFSKQLLGIDANSFPMGVAVPVFSPA